MALSVRLDSTLELRVKTAAARLGVPVSAFIREAVSERCQAVLGPSLQEELGAEIGAVESGRIDARHTGRAFAGHLARTRHAGDVQCDANASEAE